MKRKIFYKVIVITGCLALSLTACGKKQNTETDTTQITSTTSQDSTEPTSDMNSSNTTAISKEEMQKIAENYVKLLSEQSFDKLSSDFIYDTKMQEVIDDGSLITSMEQIITTLGALKNQQTPEIIEQKPYTTVSIPCNFEAQNVNINIVFTEDGKITGINVSNYTGEEEKIVPEGIIEEEMALDIGNGMSLPGTFTKPEQEGKYPVVIFVHGSGPNDRDETVGANKPFQDIAWELAKQGIASYRYDKRTKVYPESFVGDKDATVYEETVEDAVTAITMIKTLENIDTDKVYVLGHSLGGELLPQVAENTTETVAGYIFLAAPTRKFTDIMKEQYEFLFGLIENPSEEQKEEMKKTYEELEKFDNLDSTEEDTQIFNTYVAYWKDINNYQPLVAAEKIEVPCLVLQGEEDYQVTMEDFTNWKDKFGEKENWTFHSYPGLTHIFMQGERKNAGAEYYIKQSIDKQVIQDIVNFIK